jgi:hypothetical protein
MNTFIVRIVMPDGSAGEHHGLYACGVDAVLFALDIFPDARRISARRKP